MNSIRGRQKTEDLEAKFGAAVFELAKIKDKERKIYLKKFPPDAPNKVLNHAIIEGIRLFNDETLSVGDFIPLIKFEYEEIFVWTQKEDSYSLLISKVSEKVKNIPSRKTAGSILSLAESIISGLESIEKFEYNRIYNFSEKEKNEDIHFRDQQDGYTYSSYIIKSIKDISKMIEIIELLSRDDKFYVATQNIVEAKKNHEFCQICALTPDNAKKHHHEEPNLWEFTEIIPSMEAAIVQSTRSIEGILGKPGKKKDRTKKRRSDNINIDCENIYELANKSYLDYYYELFEQRNDSAHCFGKISFKIQRQHTIKAQTFARIILYEYYLKNKSDLATAVRSTNLNINFINTFPIDFSSKKTKR